MPKVSVIIATYNRAHYIREAIDSVLEQTYKDYEIIVVDDGSTDKTREVVQAYGDKVRYFYQNNQGQAAALHRGIGQARGEYIALIDDDDMWLPNKLELQIPILEKDKEVGFVGTAMYLTNEKGEITSQWSNDPANKETFENLFEENMLGAPSVVFRKKLYDEAGGFNTSLRTTHDYDLWLRLAKVCKFKCMETPTVKWRIHSNNKHRSRVQKLKDRIQIITKPENMAHLNFVKRRIRVAKIYYTYAEHFQGMGLFGLACKSYLHAAILNPFIGRYYWPATANKVQSTAAYRILRTYLRAVYCLGRAFNMKIVSIVRRLISPKKCFGFLTYEFFSKEFVERRICDIGGFGMTATVISRYYNHARKKNFEAVTVLAKPLPEGMGWKNEINGSSVLSVPQTAPNAKFSCNDKESLEYSLYGKSKFRFILSIDLFPQYEYPLNAMPDVPLVIWIRDPWSEVELNRIATVELERVAMNVKTTEELNNIAVTNRKFFRETHGEGKIGKRKIVFATNARFLTPRAKRLYGFERLDPVFLPNPINYPDISGIKKSAKPTVCLLSRLDPVKRPWIYFDLAKRFKNVDFLVCGTSSHPFMGPVLDQYRSIDNLKFLGLVDGKNKADILAKSWALINTSVHEGLPCTFLESFAHGTPIVSSINPDDMVSKFGVYVGDQLGQGDDELTINKFSEGLDKLLSNRAKMEEMGLESRRYIEKIYSFDRFEEGLNKILSSGFKANYAY